MARPVLLTSHIKRIQLNTLIIINSIIIPIIIYPWSSGKSDSRANLQMQVTIDGAVLWKAKGSAVK